MHPQLIISGKGSYVAYGHLRLYAISLDLAVSRARPYIRGGREVTLYTHGSALREKAVYMSLSVKSLWT